MSTHGPASGPDDRRQLTPEAEERRLLDRQRMVRHRVERERAELLRDWIAGGGTEAEFDVAWPEIHTQLGRYRVMELGEKARNRSLMRFKKSP